MTRPGSTQDAAMSSRWSMSTATPPNSRNPSGFGRAANARSYQARSRSGSVEANKMLPSVGVRMQF